MTLHESHLIGIMQQKGWTVTKEYNVSAPYDSWWKAQLDQQTKVSHYTVTGLFEAWMEHPDVLAKQFGVESINPPKPKEPTILERIPVEGE